MPTKICPQCNNQFTTKHKHTIHCSSKCSGLSRRTHNYLKICQYCNKEYISSNKTQKFCNASCQGKAIRKDNIHNCSYCGKEINKPTRKDSLNTFCNRGCYTEFSKQIIITKQCSTCGKDISRPSYVFKTDKVYCSSECTSKKDTVLTCKVCNTKFCSIQYRKANNKNGFTIIRPFRSTCSTKCHFEYYKTNQERKDKISFAFSGEKHPNYVNGCSKNGRIRKTELKEIFSLSDKRKLLIKFNNTCFNCGSKDNLTIDHHLPFSKGGRLTESNSVVLCRSCNSSKNAKHPNKFYSAKQLKELKFLGIDSNSLFNFVF